MLRESLKKKKREYLERRVHKNEPLDGESERDVHGTRQEDVDAGGHVQVRVAGERDNGEGGGRRVVGRVLLDELPNLLDANH